jgi:hypothetical protein
MSIQHPKEALRSITHAIVRVHLFSINIKTGLKQLCLCLNRALQTLSKRSKTHNRNMRIAQRRAVLTFNRG